MSFLQILRSSRLFFFLLTNKSFKLKSSMFSTSTSFSIADRFRHQTEFSTPSNKFDEPLNEYVDMSKKILPMDIKKQFKLVINLSRNLEGDMVIRLFKNLRGFNVSSFSPLKLKDAKLFIEAIDNLLASLPLEYPSKPNVIHTAFESILPPMFVKTVYEPQIIQTNLQTLEVRFVDSRIIGHLIVEFTCTDTLSENKTNKFEFTIKALPWLRQQIVNLLKEHGVGEFSSLKIPKWLEQKSLDG
ncbi:hypothetical protein Mgra_00008237 [Meloidogyne graminicola]|uniref:Uncharacterized protein n=1 Tax=Meloidogyne graminicola TaxID=189291 RepID=A0A8S9ZG70_9BILA|nr:hypothetical protein Mgra_00008237 [Meloidogyne graminicola]